ncbi:transporter substrate-binding domain-containing protein [Stutzerimonas zhaodongensis]|nr:transporter substrate-binding domain-containing protein [Stutzerimonas zhaodongensis]
MKIRLLRLMLMLVVPVGTQAGVIEAAPVDAYRPLKAAEAESVREGFEAAWLERLGEALGREVALVDASVGGDLLFGKLGSGAAYYFSEIAALAANEKGPADWSDLAGELFCVTEESPHTDLVVSRFGGVARTYPSAAQALIGLKLGECQAVVEDRVLLQQIAELPEWRRFNRLLPQPENKPLTLRIEAADTALQQRIERFTASKQGSGALAEVTQHWIDEVAFQAYVLADTLDCH